MENNNKIKINDLTFSINGKKILNDIDLVFSPGKVYGLLGNNGAGKTTLVKILFNEISKYKGNITYNGNDIKNIDKYNWHYFSENNVLPKKISVEHYLKYNFDLSKGPKETFSKKLKQTLQFININFDIKQKIGQLSSGQQKIVSAMSLLINNPEIVFLDEPTANLDVDNKELMVDIVNHLKSKDRIIVVISHSIKELKDIFDHVVILENGTIKYNNELNNKDDVYDIFMKNTNRTRNQDLIEQVINNEAD